MQCFRFTLALSTLFTATAALQADSAQQIETTPFIEYHNRIAVFSINHLVYERIKTNALYVGVEGWAVDAINRDKLIAEGEFRMGYNYFWNGRDHFTPVLGGGFFKEFHRHHSGIAYGTLGFLYDHEFTDVFNLGLNAKGIFGGPVSERHFDWGGPVVGIDASVPITFRFGHKRHWDARFEPFDIYLHGSRASANYCGFRSTIGYRF